MIMGNHSLSQLLLLNIFGGNVYLNYPKMAEKWEIYIIDFPFFCHFLGSLNKHFLQKYSMFI